MSAIPNTREMLKLAGQAALSLYVVENYGDSIALKVYGGDSKMIVFAIKAAVLAVTNWIGAMISEMLLQAFRM